MCFTESLNVFIHNVRGDQGEDEDDEDDDDEDDDDEEEEVDPETIAPTVCQTRLWWTHTYHLEIPYY